MCLDTKKRVLVYITTPNADEANSLGRLLLEKRLVACVNIVDGINSMYWWEDEIQTDSEVLILAKTTADLAQEVIDVVCENHSYECPCVVALPIGAGNPAFLKWIGDETK